MVRAVPALNDEDWLTVDCQLRRSIFGVSLPLAFILNRIHVRPPSIDDASIHALSITDLPSS